MCLVIVASSLGSVFAGALGPFDLDVGREEENILLEPVLNGEEVGLIRIDDLEAVYDREARLMCALHKSMLKSETPKCRGKKYTMEPEVDLAASLAEALRVEASAMGFQVAERDQDEASWTVTGTLHDLRFEFEQVAFGPVLLYGHMDVEITVEDSAGAARSFRMGLHDMHHAFGGGFSFKDNLTEVLARFILESAQEIVARLNREILHAPSRIAIDDVAAKLNPKRDSEGALALAVGLSGDPTAVPVLLGLLETIKDEDYRVDIINALGNLGSPESTDVLGKRYDKEDEDCRLYSLKAWSYIGTDEAFKLIEEKGPGDRSLANKVFSKHILAARN